MQKFAKGIAKQTGLDNNRLQSTSYSRAADTLKKEIVFALGNQMSSSTKQNQKSSSANSAANTPIFKQKRYRKYIFRNQKAPNEPGIIIFLSKPSSQESLERLIYSIFKKQYQSIRTPHLIYFDQHQKVVSFSQIKQNMFTFVYITESDIGFQSDYNSTAKQTTTSTSSKPKVNFSVSAPPQICPLEQQRENLDIFVIRENLYDDYLCGRFDLEKLEDSYAELQFFLENCSREIWNYLEDFANVQYTRRKELANIVEGLDQKRIDVNEVKQVLTDVLADFEEQEFQVRTLFSQLGFDDDFIESTNLVSTLKQQQEQQSQSFFHPNSFGISTSQSRYQQSNSMRNSQQQPFRPNQSTSTSFMGATTSRNSSQMFPQNSFSAAHQSQSIENQLRSQQLEDSSDDPYNLTDPFDFLPKKASDV